MKKFLESLLEKAKEEGAEVHVIHMNADEAEPKEDSDPWVEKEKEAAEIAKKNQILYNAHIDAGFTSEETIEIMKAMLN